MSYPQQPASKAVLNEQSVYRVFTYLDGPGDIYEVDESAFAICIGPNSDIANVLVTFYDPLSPTFTSNIIISPDRSFIGRVDARPGDPYPNSAGKGGRILLSVANLYDAVLKPNGIGDLDKLQRVPPVLDVLCYFQPQPSLVVQRSDHEYLFDYYQCANDDPSRKACLLLPYFGRKYAHIAIKNAEAVGITVEARGINTAAQNAAASNIETTLSGSANLAAGAIREFEVVASANGMFDVIALIMTNANAIAGGLLHMPTRITFSDDPL